MMDRDSIEKKIAELEKQRDSFIQNVNQQIGHFTGQIAAYREMLVEPKPKLVEKKKQEAS